MFKVLALFLDLLLCFTETQEEEKMTHSTHLNNRPAWSVTEWGSRYGFSRSLAYRLIREGEVMAVKVGNRTLITKEADEAFRRRLNERGAILRNS